MQKVSGYISADKKILCEICDETDDSLQRIVDDSKDFISSKMNLEKYWQGNAALAFKEYSQNTFDEITRAEEMVTFLSSNTRQYMLQTQLININAEKAAE